MRTCISHARFLVLVNGSPKCYFRCSRGIRQGEPLLPFLSILVTEYLSKNTFMLVEDGTLDGFRPSRRENIVISHQQFTDATMSFLGANKGNAIAAKNLLNWFELMSWLRINLNKSKHYQVGEVTDF